MSYRLPNFNLLGNIWHGYMPHNGAIPATPPAFGPDEAIVPMQKYQGRFWSLITWVGAVDPPDPLFDAYLFSEGLRMPKGTDIRFWKNTSGPDVVECPAGSGYFYVVAMVRQQHEGFPNEYREAFVLPTWIPTPIPNS